MDSLPLLSVSQKENVYWGSTNPNSILLGTKLHPGQLELNLKEACPWIRSIGSRP